MADHKSNIEKARALISKTSVEVDKLLAHDDLSSARAFIGERTNQQVNFLSSMVGASTDATDNAPAFGHVQSFFGRKIERKEPIAPKDVVPTLDEREIFLKERDEFYANFPDLTNDDVFNKSKLPGGEAIVRSCAKKAGLKNFQKAAIDVLFIGKIREKVISEQKAAAQLEVAGKLVEEQKTTTPPVENISPEPTEEEIAAQLETAKGTTDNTPVVGNEGK